MGGGVHRNLLQVGVRPVSRSGVAQPVPEPDEPMVEVCGAQGAISRPYRTVDVAEKFRHVRV